MPMQLGLGLGLTFRNSIVLGSGGGVPALDPISAFFADGTDGFLFDSRNVYGAAPSAGAPPSLVKANVDGAPIATAMDRHAWGGRTSPEQLTNIVRNSSFDLPDVDWQLGTNVTISGGKLNGATSTLIAIQSPRLSVAEKFFAKFTANPQSSGGRLRLNNTHVNGTVDAAFVSGLLPTNTETLVCGLFAATGANNGTGFSLQADSAAFSGAVDDLTIHPCPGNHGAQATGTAQSKLYIVDGKPYELYDGIDDVKNTPKRLSAASGFILVKGKLNARAAGSQFSVGASDGTNRIFLGHNAFGQAYAAFGTGAAMAVGDSRVGILGTTGLRWDATTVSLLIDGVVVASQAKVGTAPAVDVSIGANNVNGSRAGFVSAYLGYQIEVDKAPTNAEALAAHNFLMAN